MAAIDFDHLKTDDIMASFRAYRAKQKAERILVPPKATLRDFIKTQADEGIKTNDPFAHDKTGQARETAARAVFIERNLHGSIRQSNRELSARGAENPFLDLSETELTKLVRDRQNAVNTGKASLAVLLEKHEQKLQEYRQLTDKLAELQQARMLDKENFAKQTVEARREISEILKPEQLALRAEMNEAILKNREQIEQERIKYNDSLTPKKINALNEKNREESQRNRENSTVIESDSVWQDIDNGNNAKSRVMKTVALRDRLANALSGVNQKLADKVRGVETLTKENLTRDRDPRIELAQAFERRQNQLKRTEIEQRGQGETGKALADVTEATRRFELAEYKIQAAERNQIILPVEELKTLRQQSAQAVLDRNNTQMYLVEIGERVDRSAAQRQIYEAIDDVADKYNINLGRPNKLEREAVVKRTELSNSAAQVTQQQEKIKEARQDMGATYNAREKNVTQEMVLDLINNPQAVRFMTHQIAKSVDKTRAISKEHDDLLSKMEEPERFIKADLERRAREGTDQENEQFLNKVDNGIKVLQERDNTLNKLKQSAQFVEAPENQHNLVGKIGDREIFANEGSLMVMKKNEVQVKIGYKSDLNELKTSALNLMGERKNDLQRASGQEAGAEMSI